MPAGLTRPPQKSELIRSDICQSGPDSSRTTFLPAFANTEANKEPDAPAPTMTTSTFSRVAMSPPLRWFDVGHVGHTKRGISVHRAVDHIDGIAAHDQIDKRSRRALPAGDLVLAHLIDEIAPLIRADLCKGPVVVVGIAGAVDRAERRTVEIRVRRPDVENARLQQRFLGGDRELLIDEMRNAGSGCAGHQSFTQGFENFDLFGRQCSVRNILGVRLAR